MARLSPDDLKEGMVLSQPVTNANGAVLLGEGTELTASLIRKIQAMDLDHVSVKGAPQSGVSVEQLLADIDERFKPIEGVQYMDVIKRAVKGHIEELYG